MKEGVVDQGPHHTLSKALAPKGPAKSDARLTPTVEMIDAVQAALPNEPAIDLDGKPGLVCGRVGGILVKPRLVPGERYRYDRSRLRPTLTSRSSNSFHNSGRSARWIDRSTARSPCSIACSLSTAWTICMWLRQDSTG